MWLNLHTLATLMAKLVRKSKMTTPPPELFLPHDTQNSKICPKWKWDALLPCFVILFIILEAVTITQIPRLSLFIKMSKWPRPPIGYTSALNFLTIYVVILTISTLKIYIPKC